MVRSTVESECTMRFGRAPSRGGAGTSVSGDVGLDARVFGSLIAFLEAQLARVPGHPDGGPMHVDGSYNLFRRAHPEFETWLAVPELGYQRASRTDIHPLQWRDRAWGVRNAVGLLRRMKNR